MNRPWDDGIEIYEIQSLAELAEWQAVEARVWSGADSEILHTGLLVTLQRYGGLLLGARDPAGEMVGVLLGFPGLKDGTVVHCSHLLGLLPEWRSRHVGLRMKLRQREVVLRQGLDLVVWTFDPAGVAECTSEHRLPGRDCLRVHAKLIWNHARRIQRRPRVRSADGVVVCQAARRGSPVGR